MENFHKIVAAIDEDESTASMGVMLYFGDTKVQARERVDKENVYKSEFLKHCILGLATLQHGGNLVLKVYENYTAFTVSIIFALYHLFKTVAIMKPYNSSFLSSRQYIMCKGLKERRPKKVIGYLIGVLKHLEANKEDELTKCMGIMQFLEDEETFLTYIKNHTQALTSIQIQLYGAAHSKMRSNEADCFKFKHEMLRTWGVPIYQNEARFDGSQMGSRYGNDD